MAYLLINQNYSKHYPIIDLSLLIENAVCNDSLSDMIVVVPTSKLVKHYKSNIIRRYTEIHNKPISHLTIFSFNQFVRHCFKKLFANSGIKILSDVVGTAPKFQLAAVA